jgi:hypothetical protein
LFYATLLLVPMVAVDKKQHKLSTQSSLARSLTHSLARLVFEQKKIFYR